jgi:hypothetical protein
MRKGLTAAPLRNTHQYKGLDLSAVSKTILPIICPALTGCDTCSSVRVTGPTRLNKPMPWSISTYAPLSRISIPATTPSSGALTAVSDATWKVTKST